jgi:hypothetical protein
MGARGRVCPRCGRGSLAGELGWIALLGVLLFGIGLASGLVSLDRVRPAAAHAPVARAAQRHPGLRPTSAVPPKARAKARRSAQPADSAAAYAASDTRTDEEVAQVISVAACPKPDTELIRKLLEEPGHPDLDRIAAQACEAAPAPPLESAQFITPQSLPRLDSSHTPVQH